MQGATAILGKGLVDVVWIRMEACGLMEAYAFTLYTLCWYNFRVSYTALLHLPLVHFSLVSGQSVHALNVTIG